MARTFFIFYVHDQERSADFYREVLGREPVLDLPGMTEFELEGGGSLGLMPEQGIRSLLGEALPDPAGANGTLPERRGRGGSSSSRSGGGRARTEPDAGSSLG